jgi:hypothetical protein
MQLDLQQDDRCYFHLGYGTGAGIPAQDLAQLEESMRQVRGHCHAPYRPAPLNLNSTRPGHNLHLQENVLDEQGDYVW